MTEEFLIKDAILGQRIIDYEKIIKLPDQDFARLYLERMKEYKEKDNWWQNDKIPKCFECHDTINGPNNLRRYYGRSLHPPCFKKAYKREEAESQVMKQYWDKVADLDLSQLN